MENIEKRNTNQHGNSELKEEEIIKALECCKMPVGSGACNNCPLKNIRDNLQKEDIKSCTTVMMESTLALINRQKAEIERLQEENKKQKLILESIEHTIHPLPFVTNFDEAITNAKSETLKELSERLESGEYGLYDWEYKEFVYPQSDIDNLLKEMAGE